MSISFIHLFFKFQNKNKISSFERLVRDIIVESGELKIVN